MTRPIAVTRKTFDAEVLASRIPVVVDFWAEWCGACATMRPTITRAAEELDGRLKVVTVDTEAEPAVAAQFAVHGLPCLAAFRDGRLVEIRSGVAPPSAVMAFLTTHATPARDGERRATQASGNADRTTGEL